MKRSRLENRDSSIELLRKLSMLMIVSCHFATHGGFDYPNYSLTIPRIWWYFLELGGNLGVNIFILISGYHLISSSSTTSRVSKIVKFMCHIITYSVIIYLIMILINQVELSLKTVLKALIPLTMNSWWFASTYFVLYILHPYKTIY